MNTFAVTRPRMEFCRRPVHYTLYLYLWSGRIYGLAGVLADNPVGDSGDRYSLGVGTPACLLDRLLPLALEVSDRGDRGPADLSASHRARLLRSNRAAATPP